MNCSLCVTYECNKVQCCALSPMMYAQASASDNAVCTCMASQMMWVLSSGNIKSKSSSEQARGSMVVTTDLVRV